MAERVQRPEEASVASLGELLKAARQAKKLTLRELAERPDVGVSATFLSRVERNDALPSDELLVRIARELDLDPTSALMHLFRERASPQVRELVPLPTAFDRAEMARSGPELPGLDAMADPLAQIVRVHRGQLEENAKLREENVRLVEDARALSAELAESKREYLPDVNRFLLSLFNYESEVVRRDLVISRSGDGTVTVTLEGITPKQGGRPIRTLEHQVFIPQAVDGSLTIAGRPVKFDIIEKPDDLRVEQKFRSESSERGSFVVNFPGGFSWSPGQRRLSYSFSYRVEKAFVMTLEEARAVYGRRTLHDAPLEWSSCFINKPVRRLESSVTFPDGYAPRYVDKWVWFTETSFLESEHNLADRLVIEREDGIEIEQGDRMVVRLRASNPLLGFSYGIVWQPLAKRQFLELIHD